MFVNPLLFYYLCRAFDSNICLHVTIKFRRYTRMDIVRHVVGQIATESTLNIFRDWFFYKGTCVYPSIEFNLILDLCLFGTSYRTMYALINGFIYLIMSQYCFRPNYLPI